MEFKKCMLVAGLVTWYVYETYMYVPCFLSLPISQNELWLFKVWVSILDSYFTADKLQSHSASFGTMLTWERKTEPSSHPVLQYVPCLNGKKKAFKAAKLNGKASTGDSFIRVVLLHTTGDPTKRIVFQHLHCYDGDDAPKWQRFTKCANGVYMSRNGKPRVTNDELLTSDLAKRSCHHHSQIQLACM